MAARKEWTGSISLAGFGVSVDIWPTQKQQKKPSMKMLDPKLKTPVIQQLVNDKGKTVDRASTLRGVEVPDGDGKRIVHLDDEAIAKINSTTKTEFVEPETFAPVDTVPLHLAERVFYVTPAAKVPGSAQNVETIWNGLRAGNLAFVGQWTKKDGEPTRLLAIVADDVGLLGYQLPYIDTVYERPQWSKDTPAPAVNEKAAATFEMFVSQAAPTGDFEYGNYVDTWLERRQAAIDAVVAGEPVQVAEVPSGAGSAPDLMAAMEASVAAAQGNAHRGPRPGGRGPEAAAKRKAGAKKAQAAKKAVKS